MALGPNDVRQFIGEIWKMILCEDVRPSAVPPGHQAESIVGCVQITGSWRGTVSIEMPISLARKLTAAMMSLKCPAEATTELFEDALGELVNMFAGNVRAVLPPPCYLSLPAVGPGKGFEIAGVQHRNLVEIGFHSFDELFCACISQVEFGPQRPAPALKSPPAKVVKFVSPSAGSSILQEGDSMLIETK